MTSIPTFTIETAYFSDAHIAEAREVGTTFIPANAGEGLYVEVRPQTWVALDVCPFEGVPSQDFEGRFILDCTSEDYAAWVAEYAPAPEPTVTEPVETPAITEPIAPAPAPQPEPTALSPMAERTLRAAHDALDTAHTAAYTAKEAALQAGDRVAENTALALMAAISAALHDVEALLRPYREAEAARNAAWMAARAAAMGFDDDEASSTPAQLRGSSVVNFEDEV